MTVFGWLQIVKGAYCFLLPDLALRSMEMGSRSPRGFIVGGLMFLVLSGWIWYCLWSA